MTKRQQAIIIIIISFILSFLNAGASFVSAADTNPTVKKLSAMNVGILRIRSGVITKYRMYIWLCCN